MKKYEFMARLMKLQFHDLHFPIIYHKKRHYLSSKICLLKRNETKFIKLRILDLKQKLHWVIQET